MDIERKQEFLLSICYNDLDRDISCLYNMSTTLPPHFFEPVHNHDNVQDHNNNHDNQPNQETNIEDLIRHFTKLRDQ